MKFKKRNILSIISFIIAMVLIFLIFKIDMLPVKYSVLVSILLLFIQAIFIVLLNNKRKSLKRAKFIVNVDNSINELNEYLIYRKAIIINLNDEINNKDKNEISIIQDTKEHVNQDTTKKRKIVTLTGFEGIFVNSYEIDVNNRIKEFFKKYGLIYETSITILYESFLNKKENFSNMRLKIEDAGLIIKKLYGNNGIIDENEYKRVNLSDNEVKKRY